MSTAAQIDANRENARHSTGPVTDEGKARSSQNRFKHGFCGHFEVLEYEDQDAFDNLCVSLRAEHNPATPTENILVDRLAQHYWLSQRAQLLQRTALSVYASFEDQQKALSLYLRYQSTNDRAFSKCLNDLLKLRAEKRKQEIGFEREKQREAELARKHEAHETKVHSANARAAAEQKPDNDIRGVVETQLPGHAAVQFSPKKGVLSTAIDNFAAELDAAPELAKILKAA